ncbi:hypothetical protein AWJ20_3911 [Sugiyamaella lignohabitans]|uniref:LMBR1-like membrane protein n=1 Tax=Sugiyamaella lignohabitans TaxID=796027 RepID=A0A167C1T7_9ASCO|nr:uncharacterized protein AWJ20_3911 [Sugiyamaella lignohabitans]ANB11113.1 hypothetical protein AWJ20_3911 [Sugiyamaella lignohabitans]
MKKLWDSLKSNARYQAIVIGSGLVGLLYVILTSGLSLMSIKALVIALSYCYALIMALWLMGHGLVNVPRELWLRADVNVRLNNDYRHARSVCDAFADAQSSYVDVAAEITSIARFKDGSQHLEWIDELVEEVETTAFTIHSSAIAGHPTVNVDRSLLNEQYLSTLAARYYKYRARMIRHRASWQKLLKDCSIAEDIVNASRDTTNKELIFRYGRTMLPAKLARFYYVNINMYFVRTFAVLLAILSVAIIWSELVHGTVASLVNLVISVTYGVGQQLVSSIILGYMCIASFASLARIRVFNIYGLVHKGSDLSSLLFYASYACRLTVPLSYNYLTLIGSRESVFEEFLGKSINLTPLGKAFNDWLPRLILLPIIFTLFHVYDKVKDYFSFELGFDDDDEIGALNSSVIEGKELVNRALSDPNFRFAIDGAAPDSLSGANRGSPALNSRSSNEFGGIRASRDISRSSLLPTHNLSSSPSSRTFGGATSPRPWSSPQVNEFEEPTRLTESMNNVRSFFGNISQRVQSGISNIRQGDSVPRWARLSQSEDQDSQIL